MKLIRFATADSPNPFFGVVIRDQAIPFALLQSKARTSFPHLTDSRSYLANLPDSERAAKEVFAWGEQHLGELGKGECFPLNAVRLLEPVEVVALFDFGLTPRHIKNSGETIFKYEKDNPQTAPLLQAFAKALLAPKPKPVPGRPEPLSYYKCNMNTIVGDGEPSPGRVTPRGWISSLNWPSCMGTKSSRWRASASSTTFRPATCSPRSSSADSA